MTTFKEDKQPDRLWERIRVIGALAVTHQLPRPDKKTFEQILQSLRQVVAFDAATLYLLNPDKDKLEEAASLGGRVELLDFLSVGLGEGLSGWTAYKGKPLLLSHRASAGGFDPQSEYSTFLSLPLQVGDDVVGALNLGCRAERAYSDEDVTVLQFIADQLALSIAYRRLQQKIQTLSAELEKMQQQQRHREEELPSLQHLAEIAPVVSAVNHGVNNALSVIVGNVECLLSEKEIFDQKTLSRLRRIESAAQQIASFNRKILEVNMAVQDITASVESAGKADKKKTVPGHA
jgi:signal transduction protein with GAF and PtsI domain